MFTTVNILVCTCIFLQILLKYILCLFHNFIIFKPCRDVCLVLSDQLLYLEFLSLLSFQWSFCLLILTKRSLCLFRFDCWHEGFSWNELFLFKVFWLRRKNEGKIFMLLLMILFSWFRGGAVCSLSKNKACILPIIVFFMYIVVTC